MYVILIADFRLLEIPSVVIGSFQLYKRKILFKMIFQVEGGPKYLLDLDSTPV